MDCKVTIKHPKQIEIAKSKMPSFEYLSMLSDLFKIVGDDTRLKIIFALKAQELCVCDIAALLGMTQSSISHQLRLLKASRIVKYRKEGKSVYYSLDDDHVYLIINEAYKHVLHR